RLVQVRYAGRLTAAVDSVYDTATLPTSRTRRHTMTRIALTALAALAITWLSAAAQAPGEPPKKAGQPKSSTDRVPTPGDDAKPAAPKAPDGPPEFEVNFSDNSNVKVVVLDPSVTVSTRYGKLTVPVAELKRI